jgi:UDP-glucuronate decarboxylase
VEFTMLELAQVVLSLIDTPSKIQFMPLPSDDPRQRQPDIRLAREALGWEPSVPLQEGIGRTIDYFRSVV